MAEFQVPQFIERETRVVGPFTSRQCLYLGLGGGILFILFFLVPFPLFLILTFFIGGMALALAVVEIGGQSLPTIIKNFIFYLISPKIYLWKKKPLPPKVIRKLEAKEVPRIGAKSLLQKLSSLIETKTK
jgi:hypothetical protein